VLGVPHIELDGVFHQPGWTRATPEEFRARVKELAAGPGWVMDGNYTTARDLVWERADTVIYLDITWTTMLARLVPRTLSRSLRHTELWNGNREEFANIFSLDPEVNLILWALQNFKRHRQMFHDAMADPAWSDISFIRLCSSTQMALFLKNAEGTAREGGT
jgi:hypothetical protein